MNRSRGNNYNNNSSYNSYDQNYNNYGNNTNNNYNNQKNNNLKNNQERYYQQEKTYAKNYKKEEVPLSSVHDQEFIPVEELKRYCLEYVNRPNIKVVESECRTDKSIMMVDISMNPKGRDEELVYLQFPEYIKNIRRGNTIIEYYKKDYNNEFIYDSCDMGRKGMMKFTDLPYEAVRIKDDYYKNLKLIKDQSHYNSAQVIFGPIHNAMNNGYQIEVIKLIKANGENAQVSYSNGAKMWVIASKNVCLLAATRSDLEFYYPTTDKGERNRWSFAYIIGHCWFDMLEKYDNNQIAEMKRFLEGKTMVGEYVGNQFCQHLIRYMKHTILFYAIVDNYSEVNSFTVHRAYEFFRKMKLDVVPFEQIGIFSNHRDVCEALDKLYVRIAESSIIEEEEGSVIYISQTKGEKNKKEDKILCLCKLKTLEYRVYRKLREKLKNHLIDNSEKGNYESRRKITQFFDEVRSMLQGYTLPMPMNFYFKVAETAFSFVNKFYEKCQSLHNYYIDFLEVVQSSIDQTVNLKSRAIRKDNVLTYDYLLKNELSSKKVIEIIIYAPPLYLTEEFTKSIEKKFNTEIRHTFVNNYFEVKGNIIIYLINMHSFRNLNKLEDNKYIFVFGFNDDKLVTKCVGNIKEKVKNPQFISYNTNPTLTPFLVAGEENVKKAVTYYQESTKDFVENSKRYIENKITIYDIFSSEKVGNYIQDIEKVVKDIEGKIKNVDIEKIKQNAFLFDEGNNVEKEMKTRKERATKYKNHKFISLYEEHTNPFSELKEIFLKDEVEKSHLHVYEVSKQEEIKSEVKVETKVEAKVEAKVEKNEIVNGIEIITIPQIKEPIKPQVSQVEEPSKKEIVVLVPMTIPGTGKTFFVDQLKDILSKTNIAFNSISSDAIRRRIMNDLKSSRRINEDKAFQQSSKEAAYQFEEDLMQIFESLSRKNIKSLAYLDKNHPPNALNRVFEPIRTSLSNLRDIKDLNVKYVALLPDCQPFVISERKSVPFSLSYFIQCYVRIKHRRDHPTLNGNNPNLISILVMFMNNFTNFDVGEQNLMMHYKFNKVIKLPFVDDFYEGLIPDELVECAKEFFDSLPIGNAMPPLDNKILEFEKLINKYYPNPEKFKSTKSYVKDTAEPIVKNLYTGVKDILNSLSQKRAIEVIEVVDTTMKTNAAVETIPKKGGLKDLWSAPTTSVKPKIEGKKKEGSSIVEEKKTENEVQEKQVELVEPKKIETSSEIKLINNKSNRYFSSTNPSYPTNFNYLGLAFLGKRESFFNEIILKSLNAFLTFEKNLMDAKKLIANVTTTMKDRVLFSQVEKNWKVPDHKGIDKEAWHVTTLFKGGSDVSKIKNEKSYLEFERDKIVPVDIMGCVYVPEKIMTLVCKTEAQVQNDIPHITALHTSNVKPVFSNTVLSSIFGPKKEHEEYYKTVLLTDNGESGVIQISAKFDGYFRDIYIFKFEKPITVDSVMRDFE